jgi:hypothetical protein
MLRSFIVVIIALAIFSGISLADQVKGTFVKLQDDRANKTKIITVKVDGKDRGFYLSHGGTKVAGLEGTKPSAALKALKEGTRLVITFETKDGKDVCTMIQPDNPQ